MAFPQSYVTVSRRPPDIEDYIDILRRYRSWVIGPTFTGLVISVVVACWWPDTYVSTAVMRITPQAVSTSIIPSVESGRMQQRLEQMEGTILSRTTLMGMIKEPALDLYKKDQDRLPLEDLAERMRLHDVKIRPYDPGGVTQSRGGAAFQIAFSYPDRFKAKQFVSELVGKFEEENMKLQADSASTATTFLTDEMKRLKTRVDDKDSEMAKFQTENAGKLPENFQTNMMQVNSLENMISSIDDAIGRDQQQKLTLDTNLQNLKAQEAQARLDLEHTETSQTTAIKNGQLANVINKITEYNALLAAAKQKYTEAMPEIQTLKDQIKQLNDERDRLERDEAALQTLPNSTTRLVVNQAALQRVADLQSQQRSIVTQISNTQLEAENKTKHRAELEKQLSELQARIAASPVIVSRYNQLLQDLKMAKEDYEGMSKKQELSETAKSLQEHRAGEQLELLEPATAPETPSDPNRTLIIVGGTLGGLLLGFALAAGKEIKNTSLKNLKDVRAYTNLPILSSIPLLENALLVRRKRRLAWLAWSSAVIVGGILMCGAAYYHYTTLISGAAG